MGSSVPMSGAELTISEYRCGLLALFLGRVDGLEGRDQVVEDGSPPCFALKTLEAASVDDAHLLEDG